MRLGQAGPGESEGRVEFYRTLILGQRSARVFLLEAFTIKPSLQVMLLSFNVFRAAFFRGLHLRLNRSFRLRVRSAICKLTAQLSHNGLSELGLDGEHVFQVASKIFRPDLLACI